jgi:O-antigen/teichoic acid export membrane protein
MVLFPTFAKLLEDPPALTDAFHKAGKLGCALSFPLGIAFLLLGPTISSLLFGEKWPGLGFILSAMGFMYGFMGFLTANAEIYRVIHRQDMNAKIQFGFLLLYFPVYLLTCPLGLEAFVYGRMALGFTALFIHILVAVRLLRLRPLYAWQSTKGILLSAFAMAVLLRLLEMLSPVVASQFPSTFLLVLILAAGGITYAAVLRLIDREFFLELSHGLRKTILT